MKSFIILSILLAQSSCFRPMVNQEYCEDMAMRSYRGWPRASNNFNKFCKNIPIKYNKNLCQKALVKLILGFKIVDLETNFGPKIMKCFTKKDLQKWLRN